MIMRLATIIIKRFPYLHKMDNLVIDYKLRTVKYSSYSQELVPILSRINGKSYDFFIFNEDFEKLSEIIKNRELNNHAIEDEQLANLRIEKNEQEIVNLKQKLELMQKDSEILINCVKNGFTEMNDNFLKVMEQLKIEKL